MLAFIQEYSVSALCFFVVILCLWKTWFLKQDFFRPVTIYVFSQCLTLGIAYLKVDPAMTDFKPLTWMVWGGAMFAFVLGGGLYYLVGERGPTLEYKLRDVDACNWNRFFWVTLFLTAVFFVGVAGIIAKIGNFILLTADPAKLSGSDVDLGYFGFFVASSPLVVLFLGVNTFNNPKTKFRIVTCILMLVVPVLSVMAHPSRGTFFMNIAFILFCWNFFKKRIKIRSICFAIGLGMLFFIFIALTRNQYGGNTLENMALQKVIELPYKYIANNFWNLDYVLNPPSDNQYHPHTYGIAFVGYFFELARIPGSIRNSLGWDTMFNESVRKIGGYNTTGYLWEVYKDFGIIGTVLFPFLVAFMLSYLYEKMKMTKSLALNMLYILFLYYVGWSFFCAGYIIPTFWFWVYVILIGSMICKKRSSEQCDLPELPCKQLKRDA